MRIIIAQQPHSNMEFNKLHLQEVQKAGKGEGRVFFAELEFKESQALFHRLAANSLPWIVHLPPALNIGSDGPLKIKHEDVVSVLSGRRL